MYAHVLHQIRIGLYHHVGGIIHRDALKCILKRFLFLFFLFFKSALPILNISSWVPTEMLLHF